MKYELPASRYPLTSLCILFHPSTSLKGQAPSHANLRPLSLSLAEAQIIRLFQTLNPKPCQDKSVISGALFSA